MFDMMHLLLPQQSHVCLPPICSLYVKQFGSVTCLVLLLSSHLIFIACRNLSACPLKHGTYKIPTQTKRLKTEELILNMAREVCEFVRFAAIKNWRQVGSIMLGYCIL